MELSKARLKIFTFLIILIGISLIFRLFQKQILQKSYYLNLAKKQYTVTREVFPTRGKIFVNDFQSQSPQPIAINLHFYDLLVIPKNIEDPAEVSAKLSPLLDIPEKEIFDKIDNEKPYLPPIKKKIEADTAKKIEALDLTGVMLVPNMWRLYPEKTLACHILGFVDSGGEGRYGVEGYYNQELKGEVGKQNIDRNDINPSYLYFLNQDQIRNGSDLYLTLDRNIQFMAEQKLKEGIENTKADSGSIVIMEPGSGKILAMASWPNFDPNLYNEQESIDIFNNPATTNSYEPGSVFKTVSMSTGIDTGKVTPETQSVFPACIQVMSYKICTSTGKAYGRETMTQVLENSDNVAMVWVIDQVGSETFYKYIKDFGFGEKTGIDLETEAAGNVLDIKEWRDVSRATMAFGQGIAVTPIQLIEAISAIANGGKLVQPFVVEKIVGSDGKSIEKETKVVRQVIKPETAKIITQMMVSVVEKGHGKRAGVPGYWVAGKTGTAQIPDPNKKGYLEGANIGSFAGFAPANDPKFAMLVRVDRPKTVEWAESSAAPIFGDMAKWLLNYYQIPKER